VIDDWRLPQSKMTSLYISVKPKEFVGIENGVGVGLAYVESAWAAVVCPFEEVAEQFIAAMILLLCQSCSSSS
jgi:hypothetical protein